MKLQTRGMGEPEMIQIVDWIDKIINDPDNEKLCSDILLDVNELCSKFPIYKH